MAITTSESIGRAKALVCADCGWEGTLMRLDANGRRIHFDACPTGPAPEPEPVLIAHDPLATPGRGSLGQRPRPTADIRALERLRELGHGLTMQKSVRDPNEVHAYVGVTEPEKLELKTEVLRARMAEGEFRVVPGPTAREGEPVAGAGGTRALGRTAKSTD